MVNQKKTLFFLALVIFIFYKTIINLFLPEITLVDFDRFFVFIIIGLVLFQITVLKYSKIRILSFTSMFLLFSYLFNSGQVFTNLLGGEFIWKAQDVLTVYGYYVYRDSVLLALDSIYFVFLGILFYNMRQHNLMKSTLSNTDRLWGVTWNRKDLLTLGIVVICISLPFNLYMFIVRLISYLTMGYSNVADNSFNNVIIYISDMFLAGSILIVGTSGEKIKKSFT